MMSPKRPLEMTLIVRRPKRYTKVGWFVAEAGSMFWDEVSVTYGRPCQ